MLPTACLNRPHVDSSRTDSFILNKSLLCAISAYHRFNSMNQFTEFQDATLRDADTLELLAWIIRKRKRFRVTGQSMMPFLVPGEEVLIDPNAYTSRSPEPGDIVVAEHPNFQGFCLVKRVVAVLDSGDCIVMGDNTSESTDSRNFGAVPPQKILGKVTSRFAR